MIDVTEHLKLVWAVIHKFNYHPPAGMDYEDLFQTGCIGLMKGAEKFNPELGHAFSSCAVPLIRNEITKLIMMHTRKKRQGQTINIENRLSDMGLTIAEVIPSNQTTEDEVISRELSSYCMKIEPEITLLLALGYTQRDIADKLGISQQRISQRVKSLRKLIV